MLARRNFITLAAGLAAREVWAAEDHVIAAYDSQGIHRTGTAVDNASARWLAGRVEANGLTARLEPFPVNRLDPGECFLEAGGRRITGVPLYDAPLGDSAGVRGTIGPAGSSADIGWLEAVPNGEGEELVGHRKSGRHKALIAVTRGGSPGLSLINAPNFVNPFGPPVLQVASQESAWLRELEGGATGHVTVQGVRTAVDALNVVAVRKGTEPGLAPVVVMTPRSGWWQCASERGGGIACWLEVMRSVERPARDFIFIASSGHELGHMGLSAFIRSNPTLVKSALAWIHFGANIAAAKGPGGTLQCSTDALEAMAMKEITGAGLKVNRRPRGRIPNGEAGNIHRGGGQYVSLVGGNELFHNPSDRWPVAVDVSALTRFAQAFSGTASILARNS